MPLRIRKACCTQNACACGDPGQRYFVDATITVPRTASLEQAHATSDAIEKRIGDIVPADVMVHIEPRAPSNEDLFETIRAIAQRQGPRDSRIVRTPFGRAPVRRSAPRSERNAGACAKRTTRRRSLKTTFGREPTLGR